MAGRGYQAGLPLYNILYFFKKKKRQQQSDKTQFQEVGTSASFSFSLSKCKVLKKTSHRTESAPRALSSPAPCCGAHDGSSGGASPDHPGTEATPGGGSPEKGCHSFPSSSPMCHPVLWPQTKAYLTHLAAGTDRQTMC